MRVATFDPEAAEGGRFRLGDDWAGFLGRLDDGRIAEAERGLREFLDVETLDGKRWLDVGTGSGLFGLAARGLGATVHSFDFDPGSVACSTGLRERFRPGDTGWTIEGGATLDPATLTRHGRFDVTYASGVLRRAAGMWRAIDNVAKTVGPGGRMWLALTLDDGWHADLWRRVRTIHASGRAGRGLVLGVFFPYYAFRGLLEDIAHLRDPALRYREYKRRRALTTTQDWIDRLGGYLHEVAQPDEVISFCRDRGFALERQRDAEYLFRRD